MSLWDILSGAGYALDTPGALLRGLLAGRPGQRVGGRELLESHGILGKNQEGFDAGDVPGFLAEMVLDPLNLVPFVALAKGGKYLGKAARAAGPRYATKMSDIAGAGAGKYLRDGDEVLKYIPPGSRSLGGGSEAEAILTPAGRVIRFDTLPYAESKPYLFKNRAKSDDILQPSHVVETKDGIVENLPRVQIAHPVYEDAIKNRVSDLTSGAMPPLRQQAMTRKLADRISKRGEGMRWLADEGDDDIAAAMSMIGKSSERLAKGRGVDAMSQRAEDIAMGRWNPFPEDGVASEMIHPHVDRIRQATEALMSRSPAARGGVTLQELVEGTAKTMPDRAGWAPASNEFTQAMETLRAGQYVDQPLVREMTHGMVESDAIDQLRRISDMLDSRLRKQGINWDDNTAGNWGLVGSHMKATDPGLMQRAMDESYQYIKKDIPFNTPTTPGPENMATKMGDRLGYRDMVRREWEHLAATDPTLRNALLGTTVAYSAPKTAMANRR